MQFSPEFKSAYNDYHELLTKKYPQKTILKLVGDRYKLSGSERSILFRGVSPLEVSSLRKKKTVNIVSLTNSKLCIDGLNQLWTIAAYLSGGMVFISTDGFIRDASEVHGKTIKLNLIDKSIKILIRNLVSINKCSFGIYIDEQVNNSADIISKIKTIAAKEELVLKVIITKTVDYTLKNISNGYIATSDSEIIDNSKVSVIDFARFCLESEFNPYFFNLEKLKI